MSQLHVFVSVQTLAKVPATTYSIIDIESCPIAPHNRLCLPAEKLFFLQSTNGFIFG